MRSDLRLWRDWCFEWLLISAAIVAVGVALEGPELWYEISGMIRRWFHASATGEDHRTPDWVKVLALLGWVLVVLGVAGEGLTDALVSKADSNLQTFSDITLANAEREAGFALTRAGEVRTFADEAAEAAKRARNQSDKATASASTALSLADGARKEADSFERDIVSAKTQAAEAESHLAGALREAASATKELQDIRSPRSLTNVSTLHLQLAAFMGTEYTLCVFEDDEAIQFTKAIDDVLQRAGWMRKPVPFRLGVTSLLVFGKDRDQAIPTCIDTGLQVHVRSTESVGVLNAHPVKDLSRSIKAAIALLSALRSNILPVNGRNVGDKPSLLDQRANPTRLPPHEKRTIASAQGRLIRPVLPRREFSIPPPLSIPGTLGYFRFLTVEISLALPPATPL